MLSSLLLGLGIMAKSWLGKAVIISCVSVGTTTAVYEHNTTRRIVRVRVAKKKDFAKRIKSYGDKLTI